MKMLFMALVPVILLSGCSSRRNTPAVSQPSGPSKPAVVAPKIPKDIIDKDFVATISATKTPLIFRIHIKCVNPKVDKKISSRERIFVDLTLKDNKGKVYTGELLRQTYAEEINYEFDPTDKVPEVSIHTGRVRLIKKGLPPGRYTIEPKVRIVESGKDAVHGQYMDMGSVAVPADNSMIVTISK